MMRSIEEAVSSPAVCRTWSSSLEATPGLCDIRKAVRCIISITNVRRPSKIR